MLCLFAGLKDDRKKKYSISCHTEVCCGSIGVEEVKVNDLKLLEQYVEGSQEAFGTLVSRYEGMVSGSAARRVGLDGADDIAQAVFIVLARKAGRLCRKRELSLAGWLYRTTRFASLQYLRQQRRQKQREVKVAEEIIVVNGHNEASSECREQMAPLLDGLLDGLSGSDREAVLLRYFQDAGYQTIAETLHISENAAAKKVSRALQRLRLRLLRRGVDVSIPALGLALTFYGSACPASGMTVAWTSTAIASAGSAVLGGAAAALADQTATAMLVTQVKAACAAIIVAATVGSVSLIAAHALRAPFAVETIRPLQMEYKACSTLPDGRELFQINAGGSEKSHFLALNDSLYGFTIVGHKDRMALRALPGINKMQEVDISELTLQKGSNRWVLVRGVPQQKELLAARLIARADRMAQWVMRGDVVYAGGRRFVVDGVEANLVRLTDVADGEELILRNRK